MRRFPRHNVSLAAIADFWAGSPETADVLPDLVSHWIGWGEPFCFACGWRAPVPDGPQAWARPDTGGWIERAHLKDHFLGGSAHAANLVPLCHLCHDQMPMQTTRESALLWVRDKKSELIYPELWQAFTHAYGRNSGGQSRQTRIFRLKAKYLAWIVEVGHQARTRGLVLGPGPLPVVTEMIQRPAVRRPSPVKRYDESMLETLF